MQPSIKALFGAIVFTLLSSTAALAAPISAGSQLSTGGTLNVIGGDGSVANATGLDFTYPGSPDPDGVLTGYAGSGVLGGVGCFPDTQTACGFIKDIASFALFGGLEMFMYADNVFHFTLDAPLTVTRIPGSDDAAAALILSGQGTLFFNGFEATRGLFTLVTLNNAAGLTTYSATLFSLGTTAIPEPGSFLLMGLGLAGLLAARRKGNA